MTAFGSRTRGDFEFFFLRSRITQTILAMTFACGNRNFLLHVRQLSICIRVTLVLHTLSMSKARPIMVRDIPESTVRKLIRVAEANGVRPSRESAIRWAAIQYAKLLEQKRSA